MANYSSLYGNPTQSQLTSAYMPTPYGEAIDPFQVASATDSIPTTPWAAIGGAISAGLNIGGNLYSAFSQRNQNKKTIANLRYELQRNKARMLYDWRKENAQNLLSFWGSGVNPMSGSAAGVLTSNKNIVDQNIADMERAVQAEIDNLKAQSRSGIVSSIIGGAGAAAGAALAFSDERLKENLVRVGTAQNGLPIYLGKYTQESGLDDGKMHLFLVAQDVQTIIPEAVYKHENGFLMVDYSKALL